MENYETLNVHTEPSCETIMHYQKLLECISDLKISTKRKKELVKIIHIFINSLNEDVVASVLKALDIEFVNIPTNKEFN